MNGRAIMFSEELPSCSFFLSGVFSWIHLSHCGEILHSSSDDNTVAAGAGGDVLLLLVGRAARVGVGLVIITAAGSTTVKLDAVTRAGDAVSLARAAQGGSGVVADGAGWGAGAGAAGEAGADGRWWAGRVLVVIILVNGGRAEAGSQLLDGWGGEVGLEDVLGGVWGDWLWRLDLGDREGTSFWDVDGQAVAARLTAGAGGVLALAGRGVLGGR